MTLHYTLAQRNQIAKKLLENCPSKIFLFYGEMGMGKTTLIKAICKQLGVQDPISSPTFSLVNEYQSSEGLIYHFDFYRIEDEEELFQIGYEEYLDKNAWIFMEWPEKIPNLLPDHSTQIRIVSGENKDQRILNLL